MRRKYGEVVGIPIERSDEQVLESLPDVVKRLVENMQKLAKEAGGVIDISSLCFVYKHYFNDIAPLGIMYGDIPCKATIGLKCDIELPDEQDGERQWTKN